MNTDNNPVTGKPYYSSGLTFNRDVLPAGADGYCIPPGGWLTAILLRRLESGDVRAELTDPAGYALFTDLEIPYYTDRFGKWFEPIPNMSTATPFVLQFAPGAPAIEIMTINREAVR